MYIAHGFLVLLNCSCYRADSMLAPSQWEATLSSNAVSHWLSANLESALYYIVVSGGYMWYPSEPLHWYWANETHEVTLKSSGNIGRYLIIAWWHHQMETFRALLALCEGNSPFTGKFPSERPVTRSFDLFFDLRLKKWLSKKSIRRWFETPSRPLWRPCNGMSTRA